MSESSSSLLSQNDESAVEQIVLRAGTALLDYWPGTQQDGVTAEPSGERELGVIWKQDGSPVSKADYASNEIVVSGLRSRFASDGILSEELPLQPGSGDADRLWIIDPLDGTRSFLAGNDDFSVLVALCLGPKPLYGWLNFPARKTLAVAAAGRGAQVAGRSVAVSRFPRARPRRVYVRNTELTQPALVYPDWLDSGCAMLMLASGEFDGVIIRLLTHREWDLAAPTVLIEEAGGRVSDEHGRPIPYNLGGMPCRYFVASNGLVHDELLQLLAKENV